MVIIDAHAHIVEQIRGRTGAGPTRSLGYGRVGNGDGEFQLLPPLRTDTSFPPDVLLAFMDWQGIERAVLLQGDFYGEANEYVARAVTDYHDRFIGAAYVDPRAPHAQATFHTCVETYGFRVLKMELSEDAGLTGLYPDLRLDEPGLDWLWSRAAAEDLVVTLDLGTIGTRSYQTDELRAVLDRYPGVRIVIAHLAHPPLSQPDDPGLDSQWREQLSLGQRPNVWFDLAALPVYAPAEDYPYPTARDYIRRAVDMLGASKLLWGTDVPGLLSYATYPQLRDLVARRCDFLLEIQVAQVIGGNALDVYWAGEGTGAGVA